MEMMYYYTNRGDIQLTKLIKGIWINKKPSVTRSNRRLRLLNNYTFTS